MSELNNQIRSLQEVHGTEKLLAATEILGKKVPTDYVRVLDPLELQASLQQIDALQYRMFWKRVRHVKKLMVKKRRSLNKK